MNKEQFIEIIDNLVAGYDYNIKKCRGKIVSYGAAKSVALEAFDKLTKRRAFLFTMVTQHNDDTFVNTEVFYLEAGQNTRAFVNDAKEQIRAQHGSGAISYREIKV